MKVEFDLEWFTNLTDKELCDIAYLEAMSHESDLPKQTRDLLIALSKRLGQGTPRLIRELKAKIANMVDVYIPEEEC